MIVPLVHDLAVVTSVATACALLGRSRAGHYRARQEEQRRAGLPFGPQPRPEQPVRPTPDNALSTAEREKVLGVLTGVRLADKGRRADVGDPAGRGHLPVLDVHDAPHSARPQPGR